MIPSRDWYIIAVWYKRPDWSDWVIYRAVSKEEADRMIAELKKQGYIVRGEQE